MPAFRPLPEQDLAALPGEKLLAHQIAAREAGEHAQAHTSLAILVWGFEDRVRFWVRRRLQPDEFVDLDDIVGEVLASALKSSLAFRGTTIPSFGSWLREISQRRAIDYVRRRARGAREDPLPEEHEGEEEMWGTTMESPDPTQEIVERSVVEQALTELGSVHARVVELAGPEDLGFEQRPAKEAAALVNDQFSAEINDPMTDVNVHQILSRLRKHVRELMEATDPERPRA